jgi:hypothetical protein
MSITLIEIFSIAYGRFGRRHHKHDPHVPARAIRDLSFNAIALSRDLNTGALIVKVTGTFTAPVTRKSGAPLALTDIDHFSLQRNGVEIQTIAPSASVLSYTDTTPLTGADKYDVFTITKDSFISDSSNDATVTIAAADPAAAITDLTATAS